MTDKPVLRRSMLFVPGLRDDRYDKAAATGADMICVDLEDSVAPAMKAEARAKALERQAENARKYKQYREEESKLKVEIHFLNTRDTEAQCEAAKQQAAWETTALFPMLSKGVIILKKELLRIPVYGWYASHYGMIPVDRSGGSAALKQIAEDGRKAVARGHQILIFPEGTRQLIGAPPDYKPGAIFLYQQLKVPIVPVALNSGLLWPRRRMVRYPGIITVSFLPAIPPGLPRAEAQERMQSAIERETDRLVAEERQRQAAL